MLAILFRHKTLIGIVFLVGLALTLAFALLLPAQYRSSMKILVKNERADVVVSAEATTSVDRSAVREEAINSEIQLLHSKDLLQQVVVKCKLDALEGGTQPGNAAAIEQATLRLLDGLEITPVKKSDIIEVSYSSKKPELPAMILQQIAESYLDKHLRTHHTPGTYDFFKSQSEGYGKRLREAKAKLAAMHERLKLVDLEEQKRLNLTKLVELESTKLKVEAEYEDHQHRAARLRQSIALTPPRIKTQIRVLANQYSVERLNTLLVELRNKRTQQLTKFRPEDRTIKELDQQILDTRTALGNALKNKETEEQTDINPVRQLLEGDLAKLEAGSSGLRAQKGELATQLNTYHRTLTQLDQVTVEHQELERTIKETEENYKLYARKAEESRVAEALDQKKIANVAIAEAPVPPHTPYKPNRLLILILGCVLTALIALSCAFVADYLSDTVHSPGELESLTGLPVLSTIPLFSPMEFNRQIGQRALSSTRTALQRQDG